MAEFTIDDWTVSPERNTVARNGDERRLEPRVMDLLVYLARHAGKVVGREQLIEAVWPHTYISDSALQSAISTLRKALDDNPRSPTILETIPKRGYRLIARSSAAKPVVAVLPFENLTGIEDQQHLADGLTDALIAALGRHSDLNVISRQSVMAFRGGTLSLPEIAAKLSATAVVEGSVLPGPDGASATVQLIDAATDSHLWAESVHLDPGQLFEQQRRIAEDITNELVGAAKPQPRGSTAIDPDAMNHYLLGRFHWYKLNPAHFPLALEHFEKAVAIDPNFSAAYAGVADVWGAMGYWGAMPATAVVGKIRDAIDKALETDPKSAEARMLNGAYHFHAAHDWPAARIELEKAIDLNPSLSHARLLYGLFLGSIGDPDARAQFDKSRQLDPLNPAMLMASAMHSAHEARLAIAEQQIAQLLELDPMFPPAHELRADLAWNSDAPDAPELERVFWQADAEVAERLASDANGRDALADAAELLQNRDPYVSPRIVARLFSLAREPDRAIDVLSVAIDADDLMQPDLILMMPAFEAAREHPRFGDIRERLSLPRQAP
ncbi:MAG: winged helix-turn-helix domain-containing protein [Woeseiaceae bacterium]|nr:winged helix-turn-helix domain-containing protein [Woeseiaceae bacterium]